jgi:hypothetical protein
MRCIKLKILNDSIRKILSITVKSKIEYDPDRGIISNCLSGYGGGCNSVSDVGNSFGVNSDAIGGTASIQL